MKAIMSKRLRAIITDPKANQELEVGLSKLGSKTGSANSAVISIGVHRYKIQFIQMESASKK